MKTPLVAAGLALAGLLGLAGQTPGRNPEPTKPPEPDPIPTIQVDVNLVNLLFSVRDRRGGLVAGLTKEDFTVLEDGKPQDIRTFTRETDLPLTLGLLVDVSKSQENLIEIERRAAAKFFQHVLRPKDMAFLISFGAEAELLQDLTNSPKLLQRALEGLRLSAAVGGLHPGPVPSSRPPKGTILYDAVYLAASEKLRNEVGRKAIVLITDGMDFGSSYTLQQAIEAAHKADSIIYAIYYLDPMAYGMFGASDSALKRMAQETGGRLFHVGRKLTLEDIFAQIQQEMRSQYSLSYSPSNPARDGSFRRIEVKPSQREYKVQARRGYYAPKSS